MQLGQYQMQIFASLFVILGAAVVALVCDLLKGNNEQLRELVIELKVRREEEHRRFQMLIPNALAEAVVTPKTEAPAQSPPAEQTTHKHPPLKPSLRDDKKRAISPDALAAMRRGDHLAASPLPRRGAAPESAHAVRPMVAQTPVVEQPVVAEGQPVMEQIPPPAASVQTQSPNSGPTRDWNSLLSTRRTVPTRAKRERKRMIQNPAGLLDAVMAATNSGASASTEAGFPSGFQDGFVLSRLIEGRQPVSGLVVSIGVSAPKHPDSPAPANIRNLIQSLLGSNDFAAQSGSDEFLLLYPGERGAQAQRKLAQIAEQLWDFQLRSTGALSILFSWGGVEVRGESIDEAIASATERMRETRRGRKILTMEAKPGTEAPLRRAV